MAVKAATSRRRDVLLKLIAEAASAADSPPMAPVDNALRLSAQRALLGAIFPQIRLIKVRREGGWITMTVVAAETPGDRIMDAMSTAATEIIADFPDCRIDERLIVTVGPLPCDESEDEVWVYLRAEPLET